jgi:hypothetical protein
MLSKQQIDRLALHRSSLKRFRVGREKSGAICPVEEVAWNSTRRRKKTSILVNLLAPCPLLCLSGRRWRPLRQFGIQLRQQHDAILIAAG